MEKKRVSAFSRVEIRKRKLKGKFEAKQGRSAGFIPPWGYMEIASHPPSLENAEPRVKARLREIRNSLRILTRVEYGYILPGKSYLFQCNIYVYIRESFSTN